MSAAWMISMLCAGAMGFAMQRGGTCTVAAVAEVLMHHRASRLRAMLEASLWVAGGLALAQLTPLGRHRDPGFAVDAWTMAGGVLLGLGAWLNGACVFGAVARLGSGEWAYAATPLCFFAGCLTVNAVFARPLATMLQHGVLPEAAADVVAPLFACYAIWRLSAGLRGQRDPMRSTPWWQRLWAPHAATIVIGVSFVVTLLLAGRWAYTEVLADIALGRQDPALHKGLALWLLMSLYAGALLGGRSAGPWRSMPVPVHQWLRCFAGGAIMGWGSLLIPGANDGLILVGMPSLHAYAWLAFGSMCGAIGTALLAQRTWRHRRPRVSP